ncbi:hypothetical protein D3C86_2232980 [compost metagenome]
MAVGVVPAQLGGNEIFEARLVHDLGQVGGIAEGIGQPDGLGIDAEMLEVEAAAAHDLADQ